MEDFYYYILIISFLVSFGNLLAVKHILAPTGTGKIPHFGISVFVINCTLSTCSLMQQSQNFIIKAANHAAGLRSAINPSTLNSLPETTTLGNKMIPTRHRFVNFQSEKRDSLNFCVAQKYYLSQLSVNAKH